MKENSNKLMAEIEHIQLVGTADIWNREAIPLCIINSEIEAKIFSYRFFNEFDFKMLFKQNIFTKN
ncbi:MAG TPA: hypothetical protein VEP89_16855 [Draconibacterium sp.]|nr:hypothetical protein [Draconibacterium sp.]